MFFLRSAYSLSDNDTDSNELDSGSSSTLLHSDRPSSQTTSNEGSTSSNAVLQDPASRDLPAILFESSEDEDDYNGQLKKRNLFQSLQHSSSHISLNASSISIKSGTSSRAQSDSRKLNINTKKPRKSISSNNLGVPSTYSNQSESSQQNSFMDSDVTLPSDPKLDEFTKISSSLRRKNAMKPKGTHHRTTNDLGQSVTRSKSPAHIPSVTSSSKTTNGNDVSSTPQVKEMPEILSNSTSGGVEVAVYPMERSSSTSGSHHGDDVPMIRPSVTQTSQSHDDLMIHGDDNLDDQQYSLETNNRIGSTPITQPPPFPPNNSLQGDTGDTAIVGEISVPGDFALDKPSTSPNVQSPPLNSTTTNNPISLKDISPTIMKKVETRRKPNMISFFLHLVTPQIVSTEFPEKVQSPKLQQWSPPLRSVQRISESGHSLPSDDLTPAPLAWKMEELGRLRRMESRNLVAQSRTSPETLSSPTAATPKEELRRQLQILQEDNSSNVATLLREAYVERQQSLQTQLDKALAELRDVQAENKRLTGENQSQDRSMSQLKIALDEAKREQDNSLVQINNQLRDATSSLTVLNEEKKGWQDKLDSMQHKLNAADRQVRCLDHLTRHKLEMRQEAGYGQPKRRGLLASVPASTAVIGAMRALNEEIYQTCVQLKEGLERTTVSSTRHKPQVQKVLGDHLTAMMEDQAKKVTGYNMLLMQTVLQVFMTHWCSSIIDAFYPQQESFTDLLVHLSAQTTNTSGFTAICGKQIKIIHSSTHCDSVKFNEWVKDIIDELGLFLTMAGLRVKTRCATLFSKKTLALVKVAYDLRTAMAEKDICGGLETVIVPPDTPFQEKWMTVDGRADPTKKVDNKKVDNMDQSRVDFVAGTTGIGLQRKVSETVSGELQSRMEMELKPKVTLAQALNVKN